MISDFKQKMKDSSNDELFEVLTSRDKYQQAAFDAAAEELLSRGYKERVSILLENNKNTDTKNAPEKDAEENLTELYSPAAIIGFSVFFTSFFGSLLMAYNFRKLGNRDKSKAAITFGLLYNFILINLLLVHTPDFLKPIVPWLLPLGGVFLFYFFKPYYPKNMKYKAKPVLALIFLPIVLVFLYYLILSFTI